MKDRLKEHMEGWRFCEKCGMKLYQKIDGCSGTIHLKCHRCNTLLRIERSDPLKKSGALHPEYGLFAPSNGPSPPGDV